eukprot:SAG31_NODE_39871_length_285_cov_0.548387_1_plen_94_part_11
MAVRHRILQCIRYGVYDDALAEDISSQPRYTEQHIEPLRLHVYEELHTGCVLPLPGEPEPYEGSKSDIDLSEPDTEPPPPSNDKDNGADDDVDY